MKKVLTLMAVLSGILPGAGEPRSWDTLVDHFFDEYYRFNPSAATSAGFHQYDTQLEDYSAASVQRYVAALHGFEVEVSAFPAAGLSREQAPDRDLVLATIRAALLDLETIRNYQRNPDNYTSTATNAVFVVMSRSFAPPEQRLKAVVERERQIPALLAAARANLKSPPRRIHRNRPGTTPGHDFVSSERRSPGLQRSERSGTARSVSEIQRRRSP